jgi:hypothetical protein
VFVCVHLCVCPQAKTHSRSYKLTFSVCVCVVRRVCADVCLSAFVHLWCVCVCMCVCVSECVRGEDLCGCVWVCVFVCVGTNARVLIHVGVFVYVFMCVFVLCMCA